MDFNVYRSDDGRMFVQSKSEGFVASYRYGEWVNDLMFDPYELQEIPRVEDPTEAQNIVQAAKRSLSRW